jgi:TonB family protein
MRYSKASMKVSCSVASLCFSVLWVESATSSAAEITSAVTTPYQIVYKPDAQAFYPVTSIQMQEQGVVVIRICWNENGTVIDSKVETSSGKKRLDDAAVKVGKKYKLKPGTVDGKPIAGCGKTPLKFRLD